MVEHTRNPVIIPEATDRKVRCPACKSDDYGGRKVMGVVTFTCRACKTQFGGGLPQEPADPRIPLPPMNPMTKPAVTINIDRNGIASEERRPVSLTQEFRKGSLIPPPGEEDV